MKYRKTKDEALQLLKESCGKTYPEAAPLALKKENTCDISVIIPAYNMGDFSEYRKSLFHRCLISVASQFCHSVDFGCEIILVDDGSADNTASVMEEFRNDPRLDDGYHSVKVTVIRQTHLGVAAARNAGLRCAGGKYIAFLDADDNFFSDFYLKTLYDLAEQYRADICAGKRFVGGMGPCSYEPAYPGASSGVTVLTKYEEFRHVSGYVTGKLIRRSLFDGTAFPEGLIYEDTLTQLVLYPRCRKIVCTEHEDAVYQYNVNETGITYHKNRDDLGADAVIAALECVRSLIRLRKESDESGENSGVMRPNIWWYHTVVNHLGTLLYHRVIHCSRKTRKYTFLLSCEVADLAAEEAGISMFRPVSAADFILYHHLYHQWVHAGQMSVISDRIRRTMHKKERKNAKR